MEGGGGERGKERSPHCRSSMCLWMVWDVVRHQKQEDRVGGVFHFQLFHLLNQQAFPELRIMQMAHHQYLLGAFFQFSR